MKPTKGQVVIILGALVLLLVGILIFTGILPGLRSTAKDDTVTGEITVWGVFDSEGDIMETLVADFNAVYPNVLVTYEVFDDRSYEQDLVNALASSQGPDVFMIHNSWLDKHHSKIAPLSGTSFSAKMLADNFPQVVAQDFSKDGSVFALPLYMDSLALFYNQTMLDNAGIAEPPRTWDELIQMVPRLRRVDQLGRIETAAVAIGGSEDNVNQASDLLTLLMLQEGTSMTAADARSASFADREGERALSFYTSFANPRNSQYTWDPGFVYSLDGFVQEDVAMIFNYGYQQEILRERNPFLNFSVVPMLQKTTDGEQINYANYWGFAVAKSSVQKLPAELFTIFTATNRTAQTNYLNKTKRAPALRSLISQTRNDEEIGVFSTQALTATSWRQPDAAAVDTIFSEMIDVVITGRLTPDRALRQAASDVTDLLRKINPSQTE